MSEVIVRMEMPLNCAVCRCHVDGWCYLLSAFEIQPSKCIYDSRPSWCPIIGVLPKQHGDLINREYAIASACSGLTRTLRTTEGEEKWIRVKEVRESIKSAPIIVPATEISHDEGAKT